MFPVDITRTIYWDNGINTKKKRAKFSSKMSDEEVKSELIRLGFYGEVTTKSEKYITKKHVIESFFVSNGTTEQELKKYNIVKRNVTSILNSKTRTIAKYQCKNETY